MIDPTEEKADSVIDKNLKTEEDIAQVTHRVLLLGTGDSGKTTIIKQMRKIHGHLEDKTKCSIIHFLRKKIIENAQTLSRFCNFQAGKFENAREKVLSFDWATKLESENEKFLASDLDLKETINSIKLLWSLSEFRSILDYRGQPNTFQIDCNVEYFMERIDKIFLSDYIPTDDEYFRFRMRTTGVSEEKFNIAVPPTKDKQTFVFIDVGGQRSERRKWLTMITDEIKSVVYICAISEFDMTLYEDQSVNRLRESFSLFKEVRDEGNERDMRSFLDEKTLTIFLNKYDLFLFKVARHGNKFVENFDDFEDYYNQKRGHPAKYESIEYPDINKLDMKRIYQRYLNVKFLNADLNGNSNENDGSNDNIGNINEKTEEEEKFDRLHNTIVEYVKDKFKAIYNEKYHSQDKIHFEKTCALDTDQVDRLMAHVQQDLITAHLKHAGYLS